MNENTSLADRAKALQALRKVAAGIIDAVAAMGHTGAPSGVLYAVLASQGCRIEQYDAVMSGLVQAGMLRKEGHVYFSTGRELVVKNEPVKVGLPYVDAWTREARKGLTFDGEASFTDERI